MSTSFTSAGLSWAFDTKLGVRMERAFARIGEGSHERWIEWCDTFEAQGFVSDVAAAKALDVVAPGWRRFRK